MKSSDLISPEYLEEQRLLHADPRGYGTKGSKWAETVLELAMINQAQSLLDYGCGQGSLVETLRGRVGPAFRLAEYDPAVAGKDALPEPADLVVCTDVLEHVEDDRMDAVVDHLASLTMLKAFVVVSLVPTAKTLSDGRQAHISLHPTEWWREKLRRRFVFCGGVFNPKPEKQWAVSLAPKELLHG